MNKTNTLTAADLMSRNVATLSPDDSIQNALRTFEESRISGAPVVDPEGRMVGVLTLTDVVSSEHVNDRGIAMDGRNYELTEDDDEFGDASDPAEVFFLKEDYSERVLERARVADWMTPGVICVAPDATLENVCTVMATQRIHRVFVAKAEKLLGVVTSFDVVRAFALPTARKSTKRVAPAKGAAQAKRGR